MDLNQTAFCPVCDRESQFVLHNDNVTQRKRISIRPILPTCVTCGAEVMIRAAPGLAQDAKLIVLTGTCASGKSTTAEMLISQHGFYGIDGNSVQDVLRHKLGIAQIAFNGPEMLQEIAHEIDILLSLKQDIVLSHVIIPGDLPRYREIFRHRKLNYRIFVLQPSYPTALSRSKVRTSFRGTTSEEWIRHFHDTMLMFEHQEDVIIFDNTDCSPEHSADSIIQLFRGR